LSFSACDSAFLFFYFSIIASHSAFFFLSASSSANLFSSASAAALSLAAYLAASLSALAYSAASFFALAASNLAFALSSFEVSTFSSALVVDLTSDLFDGLLDEEVSSLALDLDFSSLTLVADFSSSFLRVFSFLSALAPDFGAGDLSDFLSFLSFLFAVDDLLLVLLSLAAYSSTYPSSNSYSPSSSPSAIAPSRAASISS